MDRQLREKVSDAVRKSNDTTVESKSANESRGGRIFRLMLFIGSALTVVYLLRKSQKPTDELQSVASETDDRTKHVTEQTAETIEESGETMSERVEEESQKAGEKVQETGETAAEKTEQAGEMAAEKADESSSSSPSS